MFGFSLGAMIAFLAATRVEVGGLILCSLSPYFKEDLENLKRENGSALKKRRYRDYSKLDCATLAKRIRARQIFMFYGKKEARSLINRVQNAFDGMIAFDKYLIPVQNTGHNIADARYLETIHQLIGLLR